MIQMPRDTGPHHHPASPSRCAPPWTLIDSSFSSSTFLGDLSDGSLGLASPPPHPSDPSYQTGSTVVASISTGTHSSRHRPRLQSFAAIPKPHSREASPRTSRLTFRLVVWPLPQSHASPAWSFYLPHPFNHSQLPSPKTSRSAIVCFFPLSQFDCTPQS